MKLLEFFEAIEEKHGKSVIWDNGQFFIAVNNPDKPTFFTAWTQDNEKIGTLSTKVLYKKGEPWMAVDYVDVHGGYRRQGIARALYHVMFQGMSPEFGGLFGYGPDIASKHIGKIFKRMGAQEEDGHYYVPNPNRDMHEEWRIFRKNNTFIVVDGEMGSGWDELTEAVKYRKPQFDVEWEEAQRYPFLRRLGPEGWNRLANTGRVISITKADVGQINNTDAMDYREWSRLDPDKRERFVSALRAGNIEMPIVMKTSDGLELIAGNTRLTGMIEEDGAAIVWLIDATTLQERKGLMERFAQADVDKLFSFWAHPQSGHIYHIKVTHTMAATDPEGPIALTQFGELGPEAFDDIEVFKAAFSLGWVRAMYLEDDPAAGKQIALHGANEGIVRETLRLLLEKGLDIESMGLRGEFDGYEFDGIPEELGAV